MNYRRGSIDRAENRDRIMAAVLRCFDHRALMYKKSNCDHKIIINFCPYCGEKLNQAPEIRQSDFHKQLAPEPAYSELTLENFFQCPEVEAHNTCTNEKWFIITDREGIWMLEKHIPATKEKYNFCCFPNVDVTRRDALSGSYWTRRNYDNH
jgi:hypothetical protein